MKACRLSYLFLMPLLLSLQAGAQKTVSDTVKLSEVMVMARADIRDLAMLELRIDSLHINNSIHTDMSDMLRENTPVFIKQTTRGSMAGLSLRGTNSTHTRVSWNKIPLNSPMHGSVDISQLPFLFADDISLQYSAASMLLHDGALGGSLNLSSRPEWKKGFELNYAGAAGSFHSFDNYLSINWSNEKLSTSSRLFHTTSQNNFTYRNHDIADGGLETRKNADHTGYGLMQSVSYRPAPAHFISFHGWIQNNERGVPGLSTNESGSQNSRSRQTDKALRTVVRYKWQGKIASTELWSAADRQENRFHTDNYISGIGSFRSIETHAVSLSLYQGISSRIKFSGDHKLKALIRHHYNQVESRNLQQAENNRAKRQNLFISSSYEHMLTDKWTVNMLVKQDITGGEFHLPNMAFTSAWEMNRQISFFGGISRNMHHPSLNDLYHIPGGNPELQSETAITADAGLMYSPASIPHWHNRLSIYLRDIKNWIMWRPTPQGYWQPDNIAGVHSAGLEFTSYFESKIREFTISGSASYALNRSVNISRGNYGLFSSGGQIPYIPIHSANLRPGIAWRNWQFQYQWNAYSERYTTSNNTPDILYSLYPYFMNDIHLSKRIESKRIHLTFIASIYNLFNESYRSVLWQPMPGINYRIGLKINFR